MKELFAYRLRKDSLCLLGTAVCLLLIANAVGAAYRVTDLELSQVRGGVSITIAGDAPLQYTHFTIGEPEPRLVVDLSDAVHDLPKYHFRDLGTPLVNRIRTSQYQPYPQPSVRIVLDMPQLVPFEIRGEDRRVIITLQAAPSGTDADELPPDLSLEASTKAQGEVPATSAKEQRAAGKPTAEPPQVAVEGEVENLLVPQERETSGIEPAVPSAHPEDTSAALEMAQQESQQKKPSDDLLFSLGIREPVSYSGEGRRDPFVALSSGQEVEFGQVPLPDVEKLTIVGILEGVGGYRALAQDEKDYGYVLRKGDRVLYGYVVGIEAERVIFRLNRRGLDRTVILKLPQ